MTELSGRRNLVIYLFLAAAIALVYSPVCHFGFSVFDDARFITENPHLRTGWTLRGLGWAFTTPLDQWMPVTWLARLLEYQFFGLGAGAHHLVNVALHIANALLLFSVLKRMTGTPWRSALVAALFGLHPLCVEAVAWVTGLKDVLSMWFGLLTIWAYVRYVEQLTVHSSQFTVRGSTLHASRSLVRRSLGEGGKLPVFYGLTLLFFALALMSKPMMVTLPLVLLLLDYWPLGRTQWVKPAPIRSGAPSGSRAGIPLTQLLKEKIPFFALAAGSCVMTYWARSSMGVVIPLEKLSLGTRLANALISYVSYIGKILWPTRLTFFYPFRVDVPVTALMGAGVGLVAATVAVIWKARREPWLATGWFWYLGTLVPVIGLVQVGGQSMADRYAYVPLIGLLLMLCWGVGHRVTEQRTLKGTACVAAGAVLVVGAALSRVQVGCWKDDETLFRHAVNVTRDNWLAHNNLGVILNRAGKPRDAIAQYEQALRIKPDYADAHDNLGLALCQVGRIQEAIGHYEQALRFEPDYARAHCNLGVALEQTGRIRKAMGHYEQALRAEPDFAAAQNNLAWLLATLAPADGGDPARAVPLALRASELAGNRAAYLDTLAAAYAAAGRFNDAVATAQKAVEFAGSAGQPEVVQEINARLELYRGGRAYRQPVHAKSSRNP